MISKQRFFTILTVAFGAICGNLATADLGQYNCPHCIAPYVDIIQSIPDCECDYEERECVPLTGGNMTCGDGFTEVVEGGCGTEKCAAPGVQCCTPVADQIAIESFGSSCYSSGVCESGGDNPLCTCELESFAPRLIAPVAAEDCFMGPCGG
jgi:hypothetical protein